MNSFDVLPQFEKEFKRFFKKYKTLDDDFEKFKKVLLAAPIGVGKNFVVIHSSPTIKIVKARMACRALRDRSLRVIYAYLPAEASAQTGFEQNQRIEFIELYYKGDKENEDRDRIKEYLSNHQTFDFIAPQKIKATIIRGKKKSRRIN